MLGYYSSGSMAQNPRRNSLDRWLYDGCSDEEEEERRNIGTNAKSLVMRDDIPPPPPLLPPPPPPPSYDENIVLQVNLRRQSLVNKPCSPSATHTHQQQQQPAAKALAKVIAAPAVQVQENSDSNLEEIPSPKRTDVIEPTEYAAGASPMRKQQQSPQRPQAMVAKAGKNQRVAPLEPSSAKKGQATAVLRTEGAARRPSKSVDPRIMWEKKVAEAEKREKQAQTQVADLQRKVISLEDRIRAIKNEGKKRATAAEVKTKQPSQSADTLEAKIASEVGKLVRDREIDDELMQQLSNAVTAAVAQTLLAASKAVAPPKRLPPTGPDAKSLQLAQI